MTEYFIKVVYASIAIDKEPIYTSLTMSSQWCVRYIPGKWMKPVLSYSRFFLFENVRDAFQYIHLLSRPYQPMRELPFQGKMLWWCEAEGVDYPLTAPIRTPTDEYIDLYWQHYPHIIPNLPKMYHPDRACGLSVFANSVKLVQICTDAEIERLTKRLD